MNLVKTIVKIIDILTSSVLYSFFSVFLLLKKPFGSNQKKSNHNERTILFLASVPPIKPNKIKSEKYQKEWHVYFQRQFLSFNNQKALIFYSSEKAETCKMTQGVIGIVSQNIFKNPKIFKRTCDFFNFLKDLFVVSKILKKMHIVRVVCYAPSDRIFLAGVVRHIFKVRLIASVMGNADLAWSEYPGKAQRLKTLLLQIYEKAIAFFFFQSCDLVIAYNNHVGDYALCNGAAPEKIRRTRIYPIVTEFNVEHVIPKAELPGHPMTKKVITMWGRMSYEKKIPHALEGAFRALKTDQDIGLCVIGYGPLFDDIKQQIMREGFGDRVSILGFTPSFQLLSYIHHADVALIPLGGYSLIEACFLKKPIVCFDIEWHHELLTDGYSGYFADYPDADMVCHKLLEALRHPEEAKLRGQRAYERYRILFDPQRIRERESAYGGLKV